MYINNQIPKYVYLAASCSYGPDGYMKIGISYDYDKRIKQLQRNAPFHIRASIVVADSNPEMLEQNALYEFRTNRIKGEWFYVKPSLDCTKCSYRDYMADFAKQSYLLEANIKEFLITNADGSIIYGG